MASAWPQGGLPLLAVLVMAAGPVPADPDWPCVQRLVPSLTADIFWAGHGNTADWRADQAVSALVGKISPRSSPLESGVAALTAYAQSIPADGRAAAMEKVFSGLVEQTNVQRNQVLDRLRAVGRRQRDLTGTVATVTAQLRALPPDTPAADREEVTTRRQFLIRDYDAVGQTIRYACDVPIQLEARLGTFARTLQTYAQP